MKTRAFLMVLIVGLGVLTSYVHAQVPVRPGPDIQFEHLTKKEGLVSDYEYRSIVQDRQGFLWTGSLNGLVRYDGYRMKIYRHNPADTNSLSMNHIFTLMEDRAGYLWIGTLGGGLNRFDPRTESFARYRHNPSDPTSLRSDTVVAVLPTQNGSLWVGTMQGVDRYDRETGTFTHYLEPDEEGGTTIIATLFEDRAGELWAGGGHLDSSEQLQARLFRFDAVTDRFIPLFTPADMLLVRAIGQGGDGTLYVGTCESGFYRLDRAGARLEAPLPDPDDPNQLHAPAGDGADGVCPAPVTFIKKDRGGMLWVGTFGGGVNRYDPATHRLTRFRHNPTDPSSLSSNDVLSFYDDRQGTTWIGTQDLGINRAVPSFHRFRRIAEAEIQANKGALALTSGRRGRIWIGTGSGQLFRYDPTTDRLERMSETGPTPDELWNSAIKSLAEDRDGMIWIGTQFNGLFRFDPVQRTHTAFFPDPEDPSSSSVSTIQDVGVDEGGDVWIGTFGQGLIRYDRRSGHFTHFLHDPADAHSLSDNRVHSVYRDRQGRLWIGTYGGGLNRYNRDTETFTTYLDGVVVSRGYEDRAGRLWVLTLGDGLYAFDPTTGPMTQYTIADGLPSNNLLSMQEDDQGLLWIATPGELVRFNPETKTFATYSRDDGLENRFFTPNIATQIPDGMLFFAGERGLTRINPVDFTPNPYAPDVVITGLQVFGAPVSLTGNPAQPLQLSHQENELTFAYVGLHFANPGRNRYAYRLDGYDTEWRDAGSLRTATYTSLPPGTYTFRARAANPDGVWNEEGAALTVMIRPPWWRTIWAYALYGLLLVGGIYVVDRTQRRRLVARERERTRERELAQAREMERAHSELQQAHAHLKATQQQLVQQEKLASLGQLTAGIAHEIKNPLNFVNNFAEVNTELADELRAEIRAGRGRAVDEVADSLEEIAMGLKTNAVQIAKHGKRADAIVKSMMEHASEGSTERYEVGINGLVDEYVTLAYHGKQAQVPGLEVTIKRTFDERAGSVEMAPKEIGRVMLNLLGNALDAAWEARVAKGEGYEPTVSVSTRRGDSGVEIRVADNGPGIPAGIKDKIFEPFFTTKPTGSGTGLGLSLAYDIVTQGHGGTLTVESSEGEGATFVVTLPAG